MGQVCLGCSDSMLIVIFDLGVRFGCRDERANKETQYMEYPPVQVKTDPATDSFFQGLLLRM